MDRNLEVPVAFSARTALGRLSAFGTVGAGIAAVHILFGVGLPCPLLSVTGLQCPLCGATRAAGAMVRGDWAAAWSYNALLVIGLGVAVLCAIAWLMELAGGPVIRPPAAWRPFTQRKAYLIAGVVATLFMLLRNIG